MGAAKLSVLAGLEAAGWPLGVTLAVVLVGDRVRESRRRAALNRALHELRRPLQALVLSPAASPEAGSQAVRAAIAALGDLDREINGGPRPFAPRPVACRALVQAAVERGRGSPRPPTVRSSSAGGRARRWSWQIPTGSLRRSTT
jgi:hypothetical protein